MDNDKKEFNLCMTSSINLFQKLKRIYVNGDIENKVSNILNISFAYVEGESLIMALKDIAVSSGSSLYISKFRAILRVEGSWKKR